MARLTVSRALEPDDEETLAAYLEIAKRTLAKEAAKAERQGGRTIGEAFSEGDVGSFVGDFYTDWKRPGPVSLTGLSCPL